MVGRTRCPTDEVVSGVAQSADCIGGLTARSLRYYTDYESAAPL